MGLLGVETEANELPVTDVTPRLLLWRENQTAYDIFYRVASHGQWERAGMEGRVVGLNGQYLINYLKLTFKAPEIPALLDDVYCILSGWLDAQNKNREK